MMPIYLTQTISHVGDHLHMEPLPPHQMTQRPWVISLRNLNIRDVQGSGLTQAIQEVHIGSFDLMILTETKITDQDYFHISLG